MTKKDYFRLADAIREAIRRNPLDEGGGRLRQDGIKVVSEEIAKALKADNSKFEPDRFFWYIDHGHMQGWGRGTGRGGR